MSSLHRPIHTEDRGSVSVWMMTMSLASVLLVGLAVDATGQVHATTRAQAIAAEAARVGGQHLHGPGAVRGHDPTLNPAAAATAATAYLAAVPDLAGTATITSATHVVVTTTGRYQTRFLALIGITSLPVSGRAEVEIHRAVEGSAR